MQVGTTKDHDLYNKPSAVVHPEALAAGTLPQYSIIQYNTAMLIQYKIYSSAVSKVLNIRPILNDVQCSKFVYIPTFD